jgi:glucose-6-phosphate dehydrogenase assembly protein OpcA
VTAAAFDSGRLLAELDEQWRQLGKSETGVLRACSMTLIAAAGAGRNPQDLGATLAELMREHPSRTILLRVGQAGSPLETRTSIQCWMPFGRRQQICCEQIEIAAGLDSLSDVPPILFGLIVPDLPVALWCPDLDLALRPELRPVLALAGKVIIDSSCLPAAALAWQEIQKLQGARRRLADLVWARLTRWRELLFQALSGRDQRHAPFKARITWAGEPFPPAAMYLAAWLVSRLGWQNQVKERVELACEDPAMPPPGSGRLRSLSLEGESCAIRLRRPAGEALAIEIDGVSAGALFPVFDDAALLREELGVPGFDQQFEQSLSLCPAVLEAAP